MHIPTSNFASDRRVEFFNKADKVLVGDYCCVITAFAGNAFKVNIVICRSYTRLKCTATV